MSSVPLAQSRHNLRWRLTQWKNMLKADEWYISVKRNQLHVTFKVRYKED